MIAVPGDRLMLHREAHLFGDPVHRLDVEALGLASVSMKANGGNAASMPLIRVSARAGEAATAAIATPASRREVMRFILKAPVVCDPRRGAAPKSCAPTATPGQTTLTE
jgi:hypothetical protein